MDQFGNLTEELLATYKSVGGVNHVQGTNLPSRLGIEQIIADLECLIFPGFKLEEPLDSENLSFVVDKRLNRILKNLSKEITKSLCFKRRITGDSQCAHKNNGQELLNCEQEAEELTGKVLAELPGIRAMIQKDVDAAVQGDPASRSREEVILAYPSVEALMIHRIAHQLWIRDIPLIPRMMSEVIHGRTGIDIHPGARIGSSLFIDHGTGVVVGETTIIGDNVKIYQGVTLGALSVKKSAANKKRHPTIEDDVTIYAGATILGGNTLIGRGSVIGGNVWLTHSIPADSRVYNKDPEYVITNKYKNTVEFHI